MNSHTETRSGLMGIIQSSTEYLTAHGKADKNGMIEFTRRIDIGANSAAIVAINSIGDVFHVDIDGSTDAIEVIYFSDAVMKATIEELENMVNRI